MNGHTRERSAVSSDTDIPADAGPDYFLGLANRLTTLREKCVKFHSLSPVYTDSDFRKTVFVKIAALCDSTALALMFMGKCLMNKQWWRSNSGIVSILTDASDDGIITHVEVFLALVRSGFTHLAFSQIETTLREFLRTVAPGDVVNATGEFKSVYECLLRTHLQRDVGWGHQIGIIDFFRVIRNLVHNNGRYMSRRGTDVRMQYRNVSYEFVHGSHTNTIPFDVIIDLVEDGLQIVQEIIEHPKIRNYAGEILDPVLKSE